MKAQVRLIVHARVLVLGLALIVGGIVTATYGAVVIGIIVATCSHPIQRRLQCQSAPTHNGKGVADG
jgi:hypothetical protein